jgi:Mg2+ and Co2+ transporter CorA
MKTKPKKKEFNSLYTSYPAELQAEIAATLTRVQDELAKAVDEVDKQSRAASVVQGCEFSIALTNLFATLNDNKDEVEKLLKLIKTN